MMTIYRAVVLGKLCYASSACGFTLADDRQHLHC